MNKGFRNRLSKYILPLLLFIFIFWDTSHAQEEKNKGPIITIINPTFEIGEIDEGSPITHTYIIKNSGKEELKIEKVQPTWGCTVAEFTKLIPPGQEGKVTLNVDSSKIKAGFTKTATIYSNDPSNPTTKIELKGSIKKYISVEPGEIIILDGLEGEELKKIVTFKAREGYPFKIEKIDSNLGEKIKTNLKTLIENSVYELEITKPASINENFIGVVTVTTNLEKRKTISIQVRGAVKSDVRVTPTMINFGNIDMSKGEISENVLKRIAILEKVKGEGLQIKGIKFNTNLPKSQVETLTEGKRYKITIILDKQNLKKGKIWRWDDHRNKLRKDTFFQGKAYRKYTVTIL